MDSDSESYGWSFDEQAHSDWLNRECKLFGYDEDRWFWEEQEEERRQAQRLRRAYDELNAAPRVRVAKRRRIHGPTIGTALSLVSLGPAPLSVAFSFLHPVELSRVEMTTKALRAPVDTVWRSLFDERIRGCRSSYPRERQYSAKECRRAVVLEECWLNFRSDLRTRHFPG